MLVVVVVEAGVSVVIGVGVTESGGAEQIEGVGGVGTVASSSPGIELSCVRTDNSTQMK